MRIPFVMLSGVEGRDGGLIGVAGVIDMAGTSREVSSDKFGFDSVERDEGSWDAGNVSVDGGRGEDRTIGAAMSGRDRDWDRRRGGEALGGWVTTLREGERPRCGLKWK